MSQLFYYFYITTGPSESRHFFYLLFLRLKTLLNTTNITVNNIIDDTASDATSLKKSNGAVTLGFKHTYFCRTPLRIWAGYDIIRQNFRCFTRDGFQRACTYIVETPLKAF